MLKKLAEHNKLRNYLYHDENQYLNLIKDIFDENDEFIGRNGKTLAIFGSSMHFNLNNGIIPFLTTKKLPWKTCLKELLWFIKGDTNNETLLNQNVKIWKANSSRSYLDSIGLNDYPENDLGPIYGYQWRHFNAPYNGCKEDYSNKGIDQLSLIINILKDESKRNSRRLIMSAWNPCQIEQMALPPCHVLCQFNVKKGNKLSCSLYQRSGDVGLGVPFNIASYAFLTHLLAHHCGLEADEFVYNLGNAHIYENHIEGLKMQIERSPLEFPKLDIINKYDNIEEYKLNDFNIIGYNHCENINLLMSE